MKYGLPLNTPKSPRALRGPLYERGQLGSLLYQRRDREDLATSFTKRMVTWLPRSEGTCL